MRPTDSFLINYRYEDMIQSKRKGSNPQFSFEHVLGLAQDLVVASSDDQNRPECLADTNLKNRISRLLSARADLPNLQNLFLDRGIREFLVNELKLVHANLVFEVAETEGRARYEIPYLDYWPNLPRPPFYLNGESEAIYKAAVSVAKQVNSGKATRKSPLTDALALLLGFQAVEGQKNIYDFARPIKPRDPTISQKLSPELYLVMQLDLLIAQIGLPTDWFEERIKKAHTWEGMTIVSYEVVSEWIGRELSLRNYDLTPFSHLRLNNQVTTGEKVRALRKNAPFNPPVAAIFGLIPWVDRHLRCEIHIPVLSDPRGPVRRGWYVATIDLPATNGVALATLCDIHSELLRKHKRLALLLSYAYLKDVYSRDTIPVPPRLRSLSPGKVTFIKPNTTDLKLRPIAMLFDDYNSFIRKVGEHWLLAEDELVYSKEVERRHMTFSHLMERLNGYLNTVNELQKQFDVRLVEMPPPEIIPTASEMESALERVLGSAVPETLRGRIAAFIVGVDPRPEEERLSESNEGESPSVYASDQSLPPKSLGFELVQILSLQFPEIPCFAMRATFSTSAVLAARAVGGAGCFIRCKFGLDSEDTLDVASLRTRLTEFARTRYGSLDRSPYTNQLDVSDDATSKEFLRRLRLLRPVEKTHNGRALLGLIARMFPDGTALRPVKLIGSGKSDAQATFFAEPRRGQEHLATRFIKVGPWLSILREYYAFENVVKPRLGSHVATVIGEPLFARSAPGSGVWGALRYSTVGFPEKHGALRSLWDLLERAVRDRGDQSEIRAALENTLTRVLYPLHSSGSTGATAACLCKHLGSLIPSLLTGRLAPSGSSPALLLNRADGLGLKDDAAALIDRSGWDELNHVLKNKRKTIPILRVTGLLDEIRLTDPNDDGDITVLHPTLGYRIRIRAPGSVLQKELGMDWLRPGLPIEISFKPDIEIVNGPRFASRDFANLLRRIIESSPKNDSLASDLGDVFYFRNVPISTFVKARHGAIHGDLNLQNILFPDKTTGWLIDFDRARSGEMVALDCAKIEVEIWNHFLLPVIAACAEIGIPQKASKTRLLDNAILLLEKVMSVLDDFPDQPFDALNSLQSLAGVPAAAVAVPLEAIGAIRTYARNILNLSDDETYWALAGYAFASVKFLRSPKRSFLPYLTAYVSRACLGKVLPSFARSLLASDATKWSLAQASMPSATSSAHREAVIRLSNMKFDSKVANTIAHAIAQSSSEPMKWPEASPPRWDIASTGSVANLTPLMGFLCLMALRSNKGRSAFYVPKISSAGKSCGTVDILGAGGFNFPSSLEIIKERARQTGGVLCAPGATLAPLDKLLMNARRATNTMKSSNLVWASILGKKSALGCTHAIIDVKFGKDSKIGLPKQEENLVIGSAELLRRLEDSFGELFSQEDGKFWVSTQPKYLPEGIHELRWIGTSADVPQCRAVGRRFILAQFESLFGRRRKEYALPDQYLNLYFDVLPKVCELVANLEDTREAIAIQWRALKEQFSPEGIDSITELVDIVENVHNSNGFSQVLPGGLQVYSRSALRRHCGRKIKQIDSYSLDQLFEILCGDDPMDPDVGIWLHTLPGEMVSMQDNGVFMTVAFRPSIISKARLDGLLDRFLSTSVEVE